MWRDVDERVRRGDVARYACGAVRSGLAHAASPVMRLRDPRSRRDIV